MKRNEEMVAILILLIVVFVVIGVVIFFLRRGKSTEDLILSNEDVSITLREDYSNSVLTIFSTYSNPIVAEYKGREGWKYTNTINKEEYNMLLNFFTEEQIINRFRYVGLNPYKPSLIRDLLKKFENSYGVNAKSEIKFLDEESEREFNSGETYKKNVISVINLNGEHILQERNTDANQIIEIEHFIAKSEIANPNVSYYLLVDNNGMFRVNVFKVF